MLWSVDGDEGTTKTTIALSSPLKVVSFAFDMGSERAIYGGKFDALFKGLEIHIEEFGGEAAKKVGLWKNFDITVFELPKPIQLDEVRVIGAKELWNYFLALYVGALKDASVRSLVIDTGTVARRVRADMHLEYLQSQAFNPDGTRRVADGKLVAVRERLQQVEWGIANDPIRDIYTTTAGLKKNLVVTHHLTDERKDIKQSDGRVKEGVPTGNRIPEGFVHTHKFMDIALRMEKKPAHVQATYTKCGYNLDLERGVVVLNPNWDAIVNSIEMSLAGRIKLERRVPL